MSDTYRFMYHLRGWREWIDPPASPSAVAEWLPAGTFAAGMLAWPSVTPKDERWAHVPAEVWRQLRAGVTDEDRLRAHFPRLRALTPSARAPPRAARHMVDIMEFLEEPPNLVQLAHPGILSLSRAELFSVVTPAEAVYLSAAAGVACGTLRLCKGCAQIVAFPRVGRDQAYCPQCRGLKSRRTVRRRAGKQALSDEKRLRWERVSARIYKRLLREEEAERSHDTSARGRIGRLPRRREKRPLSAKRQAKWRNWSLLAWSALLRANTSDELEAWETKYAPMKPLGRPRLR